MKLFLIVCSLYSGLAFSASETGTLSESFSHRFKVSASDHLIFSNARNDVDRTAPPVQLLMNEGKLNLEYGKWNGNIHFSNRYEPNPDQKSSPSIKLEKKAVRFESRDWQVILGDSYQQLGKGIALSLFSEPAFGIDNTLEGGVAKYRPENFEVSLMGGRINVISTPVAINSVDMRMKDRNVLMSGGNLGYKFSPESQFALYYLMTMNQRKSDLDLDNRLQTFGVNFSQDNLAEAFDFYAESNVMISDKASKGQWVRNPLARANYLALSWSEAPWKVKFEAKDYDQFDFDFRKPPSLEEDVPLANVPNNFSDVTAGRLYGEYHLLSVGSKVYSSMLYGKDRLEKGDLYHALSGAKMSLGERAEAEIKFGYRWVAGHQQIYHGSLKGKTKTFPGQMAEIEIRKQLSRLQLNTNPSKEDRNSLLFSYGFSESWSGTAGFEYIPTNDLELGKNFYNLGVSYRRGPFVSRAFVGDTSGGAQCAGGVCRQAPAYSGAMFEASYLF
jgi:hypothetical protein